MELRRTRCVSLNGFLFKTWLFWRPIINYVDMWNEIWKRRRRRERRASQTCEYECKAFGRDVHAIVIAVHEHERGVVVVCRRHMYWLLYTIRALFVLPIDSFALCVNESHTQHSRARMRRDGAVSQTLGSNGSFFILSERSSSSMFFQFIFDVTNATLNSNGLLTQKLEFIIYCCR